MAQHTEPSQKPFRVIVVGAGIVGLSLSHALQLAKIDHVVLEKHSKIVSLHGAALMIFPGAARILDQFGVLKGIRESVTPIQRQIEHWPDGSVSHEPHGLIDLGSRFEVPVITIDRQSCVTHLYDGLPDKAVIRTSARVERIEHTEDGVKVHLADGSFEEGDMVVGADGVHSLTRQLMWDYAAEHDPSAIPESDKNRNALFTDYKGIYGVSDVENLRGQQTPRYEVGGSTLTR
jgi:FAD dependent monooxygenase